MSVVVVRTYGTTMGDFTRPIVDERHERADGFTIDSEGSVLTVVQGDSPVAAYSGGNWIRAKVEQ